MRGKARCSRIKLTDEPVMGLSTIVFLEISADDDRRLIVSRRSFPQLRKNMPRENPSCAVADRTRGLLYGCARKIVLL